MIQSLHGISADERSQDAESSDGRVIGLLHQVASSAQSLLSGLGMSKSTINTSNSSETTILEQLALDSLIGALKTSTEGYLRNTITNITLTFPVIFGSTQKLLL